MKINRDNCELDCEVAGHQKNHLLIGYGRYMCGRIVDGISLRNSDMDKPSYPYVMEFRDLERAYFEAKNFRERNPPTQEEQALGKVLSL